MNHSVLLLEGRKKNGEGDIQKIPRNHPKLLRFLDAEEKVNSILIYTYPRKKGIDVQEKHENLSFTSRTSEQDPRERKKNPSSSAQDTSRCFQKEKEK